MNGKKGLCLILCLLLLTGLVPLRASAYYGESVDGVWASIALTGGANKLIFSADGELEAQILYPDEYTDAQYILPEGVAYDAASNTLSLTDFNAPTANLVLTMMGGDFKIRLTGSSSLSSIRSESMGRGGSITFCGDGALELNSSAENAILVRAGGAADFVRIEPQVSLKASSGYGSVIRVENTALGDGAISFDTTDPELRAWDNRTRIDTVWTDTGLALEPRSYYGGAGLYGLEAVIDAESESLVYNVYSLGEQDGDGRYAAELIEEGVAEIDAYEPVYTPHDWIVIDAYGGAAVSRARFARFSVSASAPGGYGTVTLSQTEVGRGGSVTVELAPDKGCKLVSLTVNGREVSAVNGSYTIAGITEDKIVTATFAEAVPVKIRVTPPADTDFVVPADGAEAFVSEPFTAVVEDGAGDELGATVLWSVDPMTEGVSIGADGRVTVTPAAKRAAAEGTLDFTVVAIGEWTDLTDESASFSVSLAERKAAAIRLTRSGEPLGETDTVGIPAAGGTTTQRYGAVVYDQYGGVREEAVNWVAGDWPAGVRRDGDTLTVTDECADGSMLIVTASAASDGKVAASVTVSFVKPEEPQPDEDGEKKDEEKPEESKKGEEKSDETKTEDAKKEETKKEETKKGEPTRGGPTVSWPTVTLAEDPVYGLSWAELVTLEEDGTAAQGEEPLVGSFSIDREDDALPNVSDSFHIIFSYSEGGEAKSVTSDERTVTLAKKPLDTSMITLTPSETPYTGTAITPAVSVMDGTRLLVSGTDYTVGEYTDNIAIGEGSVEISGQGNYSGSVTKNFTISPIPGSAVSCAVASRKPEDAETKPALTLRYGEETLAEGTDYELSLLYDIPAKSGTATISFKGNYSGTRVVSFDLPNYLITEGAGSTWSKSSTAALPFTANGALGKFTELTIDGKTVPTSYYTTASGSTIVKIKADYLKSLTAGKHIVGVAYKDGKALAIFSVTEIDRRGVATGDSNNVLVWIIVLAASLIAVCAFGFVLARGSRKKKKKKSGKKKDQKE